MRILLVIIASLTLLRAQAQVQTPLPAEALGLGFSPLQATPLTTDLGNYPKANGWQLRPSMGLTAGYVFYKAGVSYLSTPFALTLYHPLTKNVTAFGGVYAAPTFFNINDPRSTFSANRQFSGNPLYQPYGFGINSGVQGGLMYTNDAHTFSISGSVWLQRGSTPVYTPPQKANNGKL